MTSYQMIFNFFILSSLSLPPKYYYAFIDYLALWSIQWPKKLLVHSLIGCLKPKEREQWKSECIIEDANEAYYPFLRKRGTFIDIRNINGKQYNQVYSKSILYQQFYKLKQFYISKFYSLKL